MAIAMVVSGSWVRPIEDTLMRSSPAPTGSMCARSTSSWRLRDGAGVLRTEHGGELALNRGQTCLVPYAADHPVSRATCTSSGAFRLIPTTDRRTLEATPCLPRPVP